MNQRLGELLIESELINSEQLEKALREQKKEKIKLGQYLIKNEIVEEKKMIKMLAKQLKVGRYNSAKYSVGKSLSDVISSEIAENYQIVPVQLQGNLLTVAMVDPMNIDAIDMLERETNYELKVVICTEQELNHIISNIFGDFRGIANAVETIDDTGMAEEDGTFDVKVSLDMAKKATVVELVNRILSQAVRDRASDIHISPEKDSIQLRFRIDGRLHNVPAPPKSMLLSIISRLKLMANMDISTNRSPQDGRFSVKLNHKEINLRVSTLPTIYGENMVLRILDTTVGIYSLAQLGMEDSDFQRLAKVIQSPYGMILSTGPTGSGKTTTLYSILKEINRPDINIITLEDPVEYRIDKIRQSQVNSKTGMSFASGIRSILRQDPDVIMVGEIRDRETASIGVHAALTGHRVLSTLHTNNAAGAIGRFIDMEIAHFLLCSVLLVMIAQRLVRQICPLCKEPYIPAENVLKYWGLLGRPNGNFVQAKGCFNCFQTGYKNRSGIFEVLTVDEVVQEMILREKSTHEIVRAAKEFGGFRTLKDNAAEKIWKGITTPEEAASVIMM